MSLFHPFKRRVSPETFSGLTLTSTTHSFEVRGQQLHTWCAWDTLFLPALLNGWPQACASILHSAALSRDAADALRSQWLPAFDALHDRASGSLDLPGWRALDKYAVRCGGGFNHRMGLHDGLLVKDNHLHTVPTRELPAFLSGIISRSRAEAPGRVVEIEVDTLEQLREVLKVDGVDVILLDNMDCPTMQSAVELRNSSGRKVDLEASGGVTLDTVRPIALTGVERIAVGFITHSAPALDIGMDVEA